MSQPVLQFVPRTVDPNNLGADLPAGEWIATCIKSALTLTKNGDPMVTLTWKVSECVESQGIESGEYVGRCQDRFIWTMPTKNWYRGQMRRVNALCAVFDIEAPAGDLKDGDAFRSFVEETEGLQGTIYTTVTKDKEGADQTNVSYRKPGSSFLMKAAEPTDDDDDAPAAPKKANGAKKK